MPWKSENFLAGSRVSDADAMRVGDGELTIQAKRENRSEVIHAMVESVGWKGKQDLAVGPIPHKNLILGDGADSSAVGAEGQAVKSASRPLEGANLPTGLGIQSDNLVVTRVSEHFPIGAEGQRVNRTCSRSPSMKAMTRGRGPQRYIAVLIR
jgi:hypothetical protein